MARRLTPRGSARAFLLSHVHAPHSPADPCVLWPYGQANGDRTDGPRKRIAHEYGVSWVTIRSIQTGKTWRHVV